MKKLVWVLGALLGVALLAVAGAYLGVWQPLERELRAPVRTGGAQAAPLRLDVPQGATLKSVLTLLQKEHVISDARLAYAYARVHKLPAPRSGEFELPLSLSPLEMLGKMHRGEVVVHTLSFPEGLSYKEIAKRVATSGLITEAQLLDLCTDAKFLTEQRVPGSSCEGYLFPDTYAFARGRTARDIVATLIARHHELFAKQVTPHIGKPVSLSAADIVTLASIVEKETGAEQERPHIASVFLNRLRLKMKLQTDPTVIYAAQLANPEFDGNIRKVDLLRDHPYNTYARAGLPPGPISNPGLKALVAVVKPDTAEDLFFVSKNDGTHVFCPTLECHERNVKIWQIAYFQKQRAKAPKKNR